MTKVIFFVGSLDSGGIENYLLRFLTYAKDKLDAIVIAKSNKFGELKPKYDELSNVRLLKFDLGYLNVGAFRQLKDFLKQEQPDAICDFTGNFAGLVMMVGALSKVPVRIAFYRNATNGFKENPVRLMYNNMVRALVKRYATHILSNSKSALNNFHPGWEADPEKFEVIYNGIDVDNFITKVNSSELKKQFDIPQDAFVIGHTGRYCFAKNHETILKVAKELTAKHSNMYFVFCGRDTDLAFAEVVKAYGLEDHTRLLGFRTDVNVMLNLFDSYIFPSVTEGQPNSLIEAMIAGIPIIASNIDPIKETVPDNYHRYLIDPYDVAGYCTAIEMQYQQKERTDQQALLDWAKEKYNHRIQFDLFLDKICNN